MAAVLLQAHLHHSPVVAQRSRTSQAASFANCGLHLANVSGGLHLAVAVFCLLQVNLHACNYQLPTPLCDLRLLSVPDPNSGMQPRWTR